MKIEKLNCQNFKGTYYLTTDSHSRTPMLAGVLTEIEKQSKNSNEPQFYIDGGDFVGQTTPLDTVVDTFIKFRQRNPNIQMIFNLGNVEIGSIVNRYDEVKKAIHKLAANDMAFVSLTMKDVAKKLNIESDDILPYIMLDDEHNGKKERILLTGVGEFSTSRADGEQLYSDAETIKQLLKKEILPVYQEQKPDKVILMSHCMTKNTNEILDYAKKIGLENIALVVGGHPHSIEDYTREGTRVLYPPSNGKGAYVVQNAIPEIKFDKVVKNKSGYDYEPVKKSKSVISNIDVNNPIPVHEAYKNLLMTEKCSKFQEKIVTAPFSLKYRNDYDFEVSEPTELGTFIANGYRDFAKADIGLLLSMDLRERVPKKGQVVNFYNICDAINVEKNIYKYRGITADELKGMMEVSLKNQQNGISNSDFFEYSDNVKIARSTHAEKDEPKVRQIYLKDENGEFMPLLDENQHQLSDKKYTVAVCDYVSGTESRASLEYFRKFPSDKVEGLTLRNCLISQYKKYEKSGLEEFKRAEMINVD